MGGNKRVVNSTISPTQQLSIISEAPPSYEASGVECPNEAAEAMQWESCSETSKSRRVKLLITGLRVKFVRHKSDLCVAKSHVSRLEPMISLHYPAV